MSTTTTDHLWRHFTAAGSSQLVIERAEGCYIWDTDGNRYLDALSALYCVNIGYGPWPEITEAAQKQLDRLPFFTNWVGFATPPALELAEKITELQATGAQFTLVLRAGEDDRTAETEGSTLDRLLEEFEFPVPEAAELP